jgi:hypothetical protein
LRDKLGRQIIGVEIVCPKQGCTFTIEGLAGLKSRLTVLTEPTDTSSWGSHGENVDDDERQHGVKVKEHHGIIAMHWSTVDRG